VLAVVLESVDDEPAEVCRRLGMKPKSVGKALHRVGRTDLARPFWRAHRPRTYKCSTDVLEDVLHMAGEDPEQAARRMGMTSKAVYEALRFQGRQDLARPFGALYERQRLAARRAAGSAS
jgi:hypothetical protein